MPIGRPQKEEPKTEDKGDAGILDKRAVSGKVDPSVLGVLRSLRRSAEQEYSDYQKTKETVLDETDPKTLEDIKTVFGLFGNPAVNKGLKRLAVETVASLVRADYVRRKSGLPSVLGKEHFREKEKVLEALEKHPKLASDALFLLTEEGGVFGDLFGED